MLRDRIDIDDFKALVYELVLLIPIGRATSYKAIASAIGYPTQSRLVGRVMGASSGIGIPAHRVVNSQGVLSAKDAFETPTTMQERLEEEGVTVENNRIRNWKNVFWNPMGEIFLAND